MIGFNLLVIRILEDKLLDIGIIFGPGHHQRQVINAIKSFKSPFTYTLYWPKFKVYQVDETGTEVLIGTSKTYDLISFFLYGLRRRFHLIRKNNRHLDILFPLYDLLVYRYIRKKDVVLGWSQVSLFTMRGVKRNGGRFILEHPMVHAEEWNAVLLREYQKFPFSLKNGTSLWSRFMLSRMCKEYLLADSINVLSTYAKKTFLERGVKAEKLIITPLYSELNYVNSPVPNGKYEKKIFLYVGRIEILKGVHYLIKAFAELNLENAELWLVGSVKEDMYSFLSEYSGTYRLMGQKNKDELIDIYTQADFLIFPSLLDAFGLVLLEAMSYGIPVIATTNTAAPDIIDEGIDGYSIPIRSVTALKEKINILYNMSDDDKTIMRLKAKEKILEEFSEEVYGKRIMFLLKNHEGSLYT